MKHKLINNNTREEILCDKVTIDGFDYYVSDEQPEEFCIRYVNNNPFFMIYDKGINHKQLKIICTNNPKIDIPKVVDSALMLANQIYQPEMSSISEFAKDLAIPKRKAFVKGYNKSQETHPFSEEDMIEFGEFMFSVCKEYQRGGTYVVTKPLDESKTYTAKEIIQLWKEQQPKTVYYE